MRSLRQGPQAGRLQIVLERGRDDNDPGAGWGITNGAVK